jgi:hypothetical protein
MIALLARTIGARFSGRANLPRMAILGIVLACALANL